MYKLSKEQIENAPDYIPVVGYEGLYEVGKDGSVWSLDYRRTGQRKELKATPLNKYGHLQVKLCKDGEQKTYPVHQLVLDVYLPKPSPELVVMHLDSDPTNNLLGNLAWGTYKENNNDPHLIALVSTPVLCIETGVVYPSTTEASRQTGINDSCISKCINGKGKTAGGYHWLKVDDPRAIALLSKTVLCVEMGVQYPSVHEASQQTGVHPTYIYKCINGKQKTAGRFHWLKVDDPRAIALQTNHPATSTSVLCEETGVVFPSLHEAERQTGVDLGYIRKCLNGKQKTAGGYHWRKVKEC